MRKVETGDDIIQLMKHLDVRVHMTDLNGESHGLATKMNDGYIVLLERSLSFDRLMLTLQHELTHIILGHLDDDVKSEAQKEMEVAMSLRGTCYE